MLDHSRGQFQVDYEARVDFERLRSARVAKAQAAMRRDGLAALVLWKDENARYLTSLHAITLQYRSTTQYGVMLFPQGQPALFLSGGEHARATVEPLTWVPGTRGGGGVQLEDTIVVTEGEPEVLNRCGFDDRLL